MSLQHIHHSSELKVICTWPSKVGTQNSITQGATKGFFSCFTLNLIFFTRVQMKVPEFYTFIHSGPWTALWKLVGNLTRKTNIQQSFNPMYTEWWTIHLSLPKLQATKKTKNRQMVYKPTLKSLNAKLPIKIQQIIHTFAEFCHIYEIVEKTQDFEGLVFCQFPGENQN